MYGFTETIIASKNAEIEQQAARIVELEAKIEHTITCLKTAANHIGDSGWVEVAPQWLLWLAENLESKQS